MKEMSDLNRQAMPELAWGSALPSVKLQRETLSNGDRLMLLAGGREEAVMLWVYFPLGEGAGEGLLAASGAMNLLLRGTALRSDAEESVRFDELGTQVQEVATKDYVGVRMLSTAAAFRESLGLLLESLTQPLYAEESFLSWRSRTAERLEVASQTPSYVARRALWQAMLGAPHRYQQLATPAAVRALERKEIEGYYRANVEGCCCQIFACGPEDEAWSATLRELLGKRPSGRSVALKGAPLVGAAGRRTVVNASAEHQQASLQLGRVLPRAGHAGDVDLQILVSLLGGYMSSRLMQNLREAKGYTYGVRAVADYGLDGGVLRVSSEVGNNYVADCVREIKVEFARLREELVGGEELQRLRSYLHGLLLRQCDGVYARLLSCREYELNGDYGEDYLDRYAAALQSVTPERLRAAAQEWLEEERFTLSVAGDAAQLAGVQW